MFSQASVILFGGGGVRYMTCIIGIGHLVGTPPLPRTWDLGTYHPTPTTDIWRSSLETCPNLFTWGPTTLWYWRLVVATERAVRILQECCLVCKRMLITESFFTGEQDFTGEHDSFYQQKYRPDIRFVRYFDGNKLETFTFLLFPYFWM